MKVYCARHAGFCLGVKRAIRMALEEVKREKVVYTLGPLIHNRGVIEELKENHIIPVETIKEIEKKDACLIIRTHGIHPSILEDVKKKLKVIDATCPRVRRAQQYVERLSDEGYHVIIVGEEDHPEVRALLGYAKGRGTIYHRGMKIGFKKVGVVPQTTLDIEHLNDAVSQILPHIVEMKVFNTICNETILRIKEALEIAKKVDLMIIIGGKHSANTTRLFQICKKIKPAYHIESEEDLSLRMFKGVKKIGISAGASTPRKQIKRIVHWLKTNL